MTTRSHHDNVEKQFGSQASAYLSSAVHASGRDLQRLAERLADFPQAHVLDMGCGAGHASFAAAGQVAQVTAYDLSSQMLEVVAQAARDKGFANIATQQGYAASSPYQGTLAPAPDAVYLRHPAGPTTLAPVIVATKVGPAGYKPAFDDGRLNPYRGPRASTGDVQQAQVWTNQVPAQTLTATTPASARVIVSTPMVQ